MHVHRNCCHAQGHMVGEEQWRIAVRDAEAVVDWRRKRLRTLQGERGAKALLKSQWRGGTGRLGGYWGRRRQSVLARAVVVSSVTGPVIGALQLDTGLRQAAALVLFLLVVHLQKVVNLQCEGFAFHINKRGEFSGIAWVCRCVCVPSYLCVEDWLGISFHGH